MPYDYESKTINNAAIDTPITDDSKMLFLKNGGLAKDSWADVKANIEAGKSQLSTNVDINGNLIAYLSTGEVFIISPAEDEKQLFNSLESDFLIPQSPTGSFSDLQVFNIPESVSPKRIVITTLLNGELNSRSDFRVRLTDGQISHGTFLETASKELELVGPSIPWNSVIFNLSFSAVVVTFDLVVSGSSTVVTLQGGRRSGEAMTAKIGSQIQVF